MTPRTLILVPLLLSAAAVGRSEPNLIDQGYRHMYNLEFTEAHRMFQDWERQNPNDPLGPVSDAAAYLFSEFDRLHILQSEFFTEDETFLPRQSKLAPDATAKRDF